MILFAVAALLAVQEPETARYQGLVANDRYASVIDHQSRETDGAHRRIDVISVYFREAPSDEAWTVYRFDIDCEAHRMQVVQATSYGQDGAVLERSGAGDPITLTPGSNGDLLRLTLCEAQPLDTPFFRTQDEAVEALRAKGPA